MSKCFIKNCNANKTQGHHLIPGRFGGKKIINICATHHEEAHTLAKKISADKMTLQSVPDNGMRLVVKFILISEALFKRKEVKVILTFDTRDYEKLMVIKNIRGKKMSMENFLKSLIKKGVTTNVL